MSRRTSFDIQVTGTDIDRDDPFVKNTAEFTTLINKYATGRWRQSRISFSRRFVAFKRLKRNVTGSSKMLLRRDELRKSWIHWNPWRAALALFRKTAWCTWHRTFGLHHSQRSSCVPRTDVWQHQTWETRASVTYHWDAFTCQSISCTVCSHNFYSIVLQRRRCNRRSSMIVAHGLIIRFTIVP